MHYIQTYYRRLDDLRRIAGAYNEGSLRQAFEELLRNIGEEHQLILYPEYPFEPFKPQAKATKLRADGALLDRLRLVHGWWEAKDEKDDLDKEIQAKLDKGYPSDNIIFEDTRQAVLLQEGQTVIRCEVTDIKPFQRLLETFFDYELPVVRDFRQARDKFLTELPQVAQALTELLQQAHAQNQAFDVKAQDFLQLCRRSIGDQVTQRHVDEMLVQHILTDQVFRAVFPLSHFHQENHLAVAIGQLEGSFLRGETRANLLRRLEPYFAAVRQAAASTITSEEKQTFLKQVYEDFYSAYNAKDADRLGVVYTPQEAVRFIVAGCDWLSQVHFDKRLIDSGLEILDPCTGTGTFVVDLLDFWRGEKTALAYKFANELHANEVSILSYYIACLNVEQCFYEITESWQEFAGLCFVNTLDNLGFEQTYEGAINDMFGGLTDENHDRIQKQNERKIPVILGNPPYNANQQNENDDNKNEAAEAVDKRIKNTYLAESTAQKTKLYDPYIRFFRWASDRLGNEGIIGFITNRSYLDSRQADGLRKSFAQEFQEIWVVDLMSDVRKNPKISGTKHNIFGIQTGVAIVFLVRNPALSECKIHYLCLDDFLTAVEKRQWLRANYLQKLAKSGEFARIKPNKQGLWLNQPTEDWDEWLPVATKEVKAGRSDKAIFKLFSLGVVTNRDDWVYGFTGQEVAEKVKFLIERYEDIRANPNTEDGGIKWTRAVKANLSKNIPYKYDDNLIRDVFYRPFVKRKLYFSTQLNEVQYKQREMFGATKNENLENLVICFSNLTTDKPFCAISTNRIPDLHFIGDTIAVSLYVYQNNEQQENITDWALTQFRQHYPTERIEKTDIFHYIYAILHDPRYRQTYALNLKQEFPRIPFYPQFSQWAEIGRQLIDLHLHFEHAQPYDLQQTDKTTAAAPKCRLKADKTQNRIEIDTQTTLENIPPQAWQYQLGNRSALEWILDQYKEKTPKDPTIREHFNTYRFADYKTEVIELLKKVCSVSVETVQLIEQIKNLPNKPKP